MTQPRIWLRVAGAWLLLAGAAHMGWHVYSVVLEHGMIGLREFAMNAMKQAQFFEPLTPSLWLHYRLYGMLFSIFLLFGGSVDLILSTDDTPRAAQSRYALMATLFWTVTFGLIAFLTPVIQPLAIVAVAVPLHGAAYISTTLAGHE